MSEKKQQICGIVMPISDCDGQDHTHWQDVKSIIEAAAEQAGFEARLVSDTYESNLIHKEILQNIYEDDIIVCDVSGRNPNVFFELGIRMATQKPTVIVKDNETDYPFDTGPNRYIEYPRSLRHPDMETFKENLIKALKSTIEQSKDRSFIGHLGPFQIPDVESKTVPGIDLILSRLDRIERLIPSKPTEPARRRRRVVSQNKLISFDDSSSEILRVLVQGYSMDSVTNGIYGFSMNPLFKDSKVEWNMKSDDRIEILVSGLKSVQAPKLKEEIHRAIDGAIPF